MTLEEKLKVFKDKGWKYDPLSGIIKSHKNNNICGVNQKGYINCTLWYDRKYITLQGHQLGWYLYYNQVPKTIDHINHITNDNRIINLRSLTIQQNNFNRRDVLGFIYDKRRNRYYSRINFNNKLVSLGGFETEFEAHQAYLEAKKIYHII